MACNSCGKARGHFNGCPTLTSSSYDSAKKKRKAQNSGDDDKPKKCPPHDWYLFTSGRDLISRQKWRCDKCTKCGKTHTYNV